MTGLIKAVNDIIYSQKKSGKPLAIVLAGHNGSGKSTLWYKRLADQFQIPLVNADRMMMSILPEYTAEFPRWAAVIRDNDQNWMHVAQRGVDGFVAQAMAHKVPFAMETVFSHWNDLGNGKVESKVDLIRQMQKNGYFVLLLFVGLTNDQLSIARVKTRVASGGHGVATEKLTTRFPRTQKAIKLATGVADAAILTDNSRTLKDAFSVCRVQIKEKVVFDCREKEGATPSAILGWLNIVSPL